MADRGGEIRYLVNTMLYKLPDPYGDLSFPAGDPWTRATGEPAKVYEGLTAYMNMGPDRSLVKVARQSGKDVTLYHRWSVKWCWVARTEAFDRYQDRLYQQEREKARRDMDSRHAKLATAGLNLVARRLLGDAATGIKALDANTVSPAEAARLVEVLAKLERLARGAPESTLGVQAVDGDGQATTSPLTLQILANPVARQKAYDLLESIATDTEPAEDEPEVEATPGMNGNEAAS